ncbi:hypothetical protein Pla123a_42380 [Posidoniimonas polymericola]|uniref:AB hydrolase-1 domain-containing protein n=1 Tax=Posidoniimonas polymericola TaxID=2528002 RepID=A0A5C5Y2A1_9BACT|nr:alpha/beta fold hydrolase [Posidoniimonas polymericola]TWT67682.1 hypothetical protein Pla123a_42380 [Posidoniimonas polymericola]
MTTVLLNGWAVSEAAARDALDAAPETNLQVIPPSPNWQELLADAQANVLVGYSTGAMLLLSEPKLAERFERVVLLAPFTDFRAESGQGGNVRSAQLKYLLRMLKKDPLTTVHDFYDRAGLKMPRPTELPLPVDDLRWGIEQLLNRSAEEWTLEDVECWVGGADPLLDAERLKELCPALHVLQGVGHDLSELAAGAGLSL